DAKLSASPLTKLNHTIGRQERAGLRNSGSQPFHAILESFTYLGSSACASRKTRADLRSNPRTQNTSSALRLRTLALWSTPHVDSQTELVSPRGSPCEVRGLCFSRMPS